MNDLFGKDDKIIRTIGLYQPFATLMLHDKIETRFVKNGHKAPFPLGDYLIYATIKCYDFFQAEDMAGDQKPQFSKSLKTERNMGASGTIHPKTADFITGHAIAFGTLVSIIDPVLPDTPNTYVQYIAPDACFRRVGLVFENVKRIRPFPFKGKQGVGIIRDQETFAKIEFV